MGNKFSLADFWLGLLRESTDDFYAEMRENLREYGVPEDTLCSAVAKLCKFLYSRDNLGLHFNRKYLYTPQDVLDLLEVNIDLSDTEFQALAILFSYPPFDTYCLVFPP